MAVLNTACGTPYQRARYGPRVAGVLGLLLLFLVWRTERSVWHRLGGLPSWEDGDRFEQQLHHHLTPAKDRCADLFAEGNSPRLTRMKKFDLSRCGFGALPPHFPWDQMHELTELDASENQLSLLPDGIEGLPRLRILLLGMNRFTAVPQVVRTLPTLEVLGMQGNDLASLGEGELPPRLTQLLLSDNNLRAIPASVSRLHSLRRLGLSGNELEVVPVHLSYIDSLEALGLAGNRLREHGGLPAELFELPRLSWVTVASNRWPLRTSGDMNNGMALNTRAAAALAAGRAILPKMEASLTIDARNTQVLLLQQLRPAAAATQVGRVFANSAVPYKLYNATVAGEPVILKVFKASAPTGLSKEEALIHELVGPHENLEGCSGVVMHLNVSADKFAELHIDLPTTNYKGGVQYYSTTHSGDSQDPSATDKAMQSTGLLMHFPAGRSRVVGRDPVEEEEERRQQSKRLHRHKDSVRDIEDWMADGVNGLRPLADHPTILKPLRSQYPHRRRFSLGFIMRVLQGVCAALEHLHKHQISHGALAAHRVLVDGEQLTLREHGHEHDHIIEMSPTGPVLLTDLSAAFSYASATTGSPGEAPEAKSRGVGDFERLEVRSFGLLIAELQARYDARRAIDDQGLFDSATKKLLDELSQTATSPAVALRPTFAELRVSLERIKEKALPEGDWYQHSHETHGSPWIAG
eukprot:COSAG02_NODE_441_length_22281_cov_6.119556_10_plen_695_part_00